MSCAINGGDVILGNTGSGLRAVISLPVVVPQADGKSAVRRVPSAGLGVRSDKRSPAV